MTAPNATANEPVSQPTLEACYRQSRVEAKGWAGPLMWCFGSLPFEQYQSTCALLAHLAQPWQMLENPPATAPTQDVCASMRGDLDDALRGRFRSPIAWAMADAVKKHRIPRQFLFEPLDGVDLAVRFPPAETWDELSVIASKIGGAAACALVHILGVEKTGFEVPAIRAGQALWLTHRLVRFPKTSPVPTERLAMEDYHAAGLDPRELSPDGSDAGVVHLVRLYGTRIEKLFHESGPLFEHLGFDGTRVFRNLLGIAWQTLVRARLNPRHLFAEPGVFTGGDLFRAKARFFLGLDPELPFCPDHHEHPPH